MDARITMTLFLHSQCKPYEKAGKMIWDNTMKSMGPTCYEFHHNSAKGVCGSMAALGVARNCFRLALSSLASHQVEHHHIS
jgi:hypothetical protein